MTKSRAGEEKGTLSVLPRALLAAVLTVSAPLVSAQDEEFCGDCHDDVSLEASIHTDFLCADCHSNVPERHPRGAIEPMSVDETCSGCHRKTIRELDQSVHAG